MKKLLKSKLLSLFLAFTMMLGLITVPTKEVKAETSKGTIVENFESGTKTAYAEGIIELKSGEWKFSNALIGKEDKDVKEGSSASRIRAQGWIEMLFDVSNVSEVEFLYGNYGTDKDTTIVLQKSLDKGITWIEVGKIDNKDNEAAPKKANFDINDSGEIRFKLLSTAGNKRANIDNFTIYQGDSEKIDLLSLKIDENISLENGESKKLSVVYEPENTTEKAVRFESLNPEIATVDNDGNVTAIKEGETTIKVISTVKENIFAETKVTVSKAQDKQGPEITNIYPAAGENLGDLRRPEIKATLYDESGIDNNSVKLYLDGNIVTANITDNLVSYNVNEDLEDGQHTVKIEVKDSLGNLSEKEWIFTVGEVTKNLYFGQLHSHTNISDGTGSVDEAYQYAENVAKVDFLAVTDHSNWFDNDTKATIADGSASTEWKTGRDAANKYNKNGEFVAIYGYEMTWSGSTGGYGHMNTFNTEGFETRSNSKMNLETYYKSLKTQPQSLSQFNHPGKTFGDFSDFANYDKEIDKVITLLEVGNGEGEIRSSGYFPSYEYYTRALDKGWHVAPSNNQDNHKGKWGNANTGRTVIEASDLSRESIYDAIRNMRVYATEDENLKISYEVNNNTMGTILPKTNNLDFEVNVEDIDSGDNIKKISIIGDGGKVVKSIDNINSTNKKWEFSLDESVSSYYYVRVEQSDKDIAVTAPVWVGERENFGISTVDKDKEVLLAGEDFNIETNIYNNEGNSINNIKIEYYKDNEETPFKSDTINTIEAGKTFTAKLPYKFDKSGTYSFVVKVSATINGILKEFKSSITMEVLGENEVSTVVIDGAHQNQYVTGDYADKVTTLTALMAQNNIKAVINKEKITDKVLENASLLILSDPQSTTNTTYGLAPQKYSQDELDAIARFVQRGGNIAITSKADYKDATGDYGNAAQGNSVLQAIGANIRFNDDQATDKDNNGGQEFRLYFTNYNIESSWLNGIDTSKKYSFYSGSTLVMPNNMSNIDILVRGHETTYGNDADTQKDNVTIEKGNVVGLAVETLSSGSKVFISGATFFSNFEMDGLDYSNYQITEKMLKELSPAPTISVSKISDVRIDSNNDNLPDRFGETVVVEGYVTAASKAAAPGNSFFDVIYVQDETAGLTVFGVSDLDIKLGQKVRIKGRVSSYLNDAQIALKNENLDVQIIDENINLIEATKLSTKDSMLEEKEGLLVKVEGKVARIEGQNIFVNDGSGESRVYVEGYIGSSENPGVADEWKSRINVGDTISAIGLASEDPEGHRLRVRDSAEIKLLKSKDLEITLFHTNDSHGRVKADKDTIGIDVISQIKKNTANSLLLDAGDTLHGLPFATLKKGEDIVNLMKLAGYDVMTPGNHDFNYGYERLLELTKIAGEGENGFPIISANTIKDNKNIMNSNIIKEIDGIKVGIFGVSTPETAYKTNPNNVKGITFSDPIETAKEQVKELKEKGADIIIALAHIGLDESSQVVSTMIADSVDGIDVIIDGHSHSTLKEGVTTKNGTLIVSTGEYEKSLGKVVITIDSSVKNIINKKASLITKAETLDIVADDFVSNKIKEIDAEQSEFLSKVVGNSKVHLEGARELSRTQETNLGNLITDAMIYETGAEIAITNGGGIRDSINVGEITKGEIVKVLPFGNYIVTKGLTGAQIKEVLEHGVKAYPSTAGHFPQISGLNFVFDESRESGNRIVGITINGKPIEMDRVYVVATNDFMAVGGDEYPNFSKVPTLNEYKSLEEALESYINKIGDVDYSVEGRIKVGVNTAPAIKANDITLNIGDKFDPLKDVTAIDNEDGDITAWIKVVEKTVDLDKAGSYKVVYEVKDSLGESTKLEIKVIIKEEILEKVKVTGVNLDKTSAKLKINESLELKASISPSNATNKEVTWTSSDEKVAKVDENGKVIAIAAGKATITVTTKDGDFKASCKITVKKDDVTPSPIEENIVGKIENPNGKNEVVIQNPSNEIKLEIKDIEAIKTGNGYLEIKNGENTIILPFSLIDKDLLKEGSSIFFEMKIKEDKTITSGIKGVKKVFEFKLYIKNGDEITNIHSFKDEVATVTLKLTDKDLKGLNKENISVFYYNEATKTFEQLETTINGNEVTFKTSHFSKFIIAEKTKNDSGITLPATGGNNPTYLLLIAFLVIGVGGVLLVKRKNKEVTNK